MPDRRKARADGRMAAFPNLDGGGVGRSPVVLRGPYSGRIVAPSGPFRGRSGTERSH